MGGDRPLRPYGRRVLRSGHRPHRDQSSVVTPWIAARVAADIGSGTLVPPGGAAQPPPGGFHSRYELHLSCLSKPKSNRTALSAGEYSPLADEKARAQA